MRGTALEVTTICVVNEVLGTVTSKASPCSLREAMKCDGDVALARDFIAFQQFRDPEDQFTPLGCCVFSTRNQGVRIVWHATGHITRARLAWQEVLLDDWRVL